MGTIQEIPVEPRRAELSETERKALAVLTRNRVAIFIVAFNAERHIEKVLSRIPPWVATRLVEIFVIDDCSRDDTVSRAHRFDRPVGSPPLRIYRTPANQGYGGNQKIGFSYAIQKGFDIVVLLHGDGQYAPEALPEILAPYADGADAVFGSRFLTRGAARSGGMPLYKFVGNRILTAIQNTGMGARMSEWHSGYRSYRTSVLARVPFSQNSNNFEFDAEIIIQVLGSGFRIEEVAIPTYYGDEICHVNGMRYAWKCVQSIAQYRLMQFELFFDPKFDVRRDPGASSPYVRKGARTSVHHHIRNLPLPPGASVLDVGGGDGTAVATDLADRGFSVVCIDQRPPGDSGNVTHIQADLDGNWEHAVEPGSQDAVLALDVLEHLKSPEQGLARIARSLRDGGELYASTGNVAFLPLRFMLLAGFFNYGRRGILDRTHTRLFTVGSFRRLMTQGGFDVKAVIGFGPPIRDLAPRGYLAAALDAVAFRLARLWTALFAYQIVVVARKRPSLDGLVDETIAFVAPGQGRRPEDARTPDHA